MFFDDFCMQLSLEFRAHVLNNDIAIQKIKYKSLQMLKSKLQEIGAFLENSKIRIDG